MEVDWELEDWLLDAGERAERKCIGGGEPSPVERLVVEFWKFDMQALNGGVSQYFCNYDLCHWLAFKSAWMPDVVPSLGPILAEIDKTIARGKDAYDAILTSPSIDAFYHDRRLSAWREMRAAASEPPAETGI